MTSTVCGNLGTSPDASLRDEEPAEPIIHVPPIRPHGDEGLIRGSCFGLRAGSCSSRALLQQLGPQMRVTPAYSYLASTTTATKTMPTTTTENL